MSDKTTKQENEIKMQVKDLDLYYGDFQALKNISMDHRPLGLRKIDLN